MDLLPRGTHRENAGGKKEDFEKLGGRGLVGESRSTRNRMTENKETMKELGGRRLVGGSPLKGNRIQPGAVKLVL